MRYTRTSRFDLCKQGRHGECRGFETVVKSMYDRRYGDRKNSTRAVSAICGCKCHKHNPAKGARL